MTESYVEVEGSLSKHLGQIPTVLGAVKARNYCQDPMLSRKRSLFHRENSLVVQLEANS